VIDNRILWQNLTSMPEEEKARVNVEAWSAVQGDKLPGGVDVMVADMAYERGAEEATKLLQQCLGFEGAECDGFAGILTVRAALATDPHQLILNYQLARLDYEHSLRGAPIEGEAMKRLRDLCTLALSLAPKEAPTVTAKAGFRKTAIVSWAAGGLVAANEVLPSIVAAVPAAKEAYTSVADLLEPYGPMPGLVLGAIVIVGIIYNQVRSARLAKATIATGASGVAVA